MIWCPKTRLLFQKILKKTMLWVNQLMILEPGGLVEPAFHAVTGRFKKHKNMDGSLETIKFRTTRYYRTIQASKWRSLHFVLNLRVGSGKP